MTDRLSAAAGLFALSLLLGDTALAQGCQWRQEGTAGPGWYDSGGSPCNSSHQAPATATAPALRWVSRWGAIAVSPSTESVGISENASSQQRAEREALTQCRANDGASDCAVDTVYRDQCLAYARGRGQTGVVDFASMNSFPLATWDALTACNRAGGDGACEILYAGCSLPAQVAGPPEMPELPHFDYPVTH